VQELALQLGVGNAVDRVADDREPDRREVDSDLVRPAGLEPDVEECVPVEKPLDLEMRDGVARRVGVERHARGLVSVAADRRLDAAPPRLRPPTDEGLVAALELPAANQVSEPAVGLLAPRDNQQPRGVPVEAMDDPRALRDVAACNAAEQAVDEGSGRVAGSRVDDDPSRLVDDQQMLVLEGDPERELLRLERDRLGGRRLEAQLLPALEPVALGPCLAVDERRAFGEQPLGGGAGADLGQRGEKAVEPLAGRFCRDDDSGQLRASLRRSATNKIATPITMNESARLNAGQ